MSRVVFFNVSAPGHIIPTLGLVKELIARGEEVMILWQVGSNNSLSIYN